MRKKTASYFYDFTSIIISSLICVTVIFTFAFKISTVNGGSMLNTLHNGDKLIVTSLHKQPERGDIVIISQPNAYAKILVKRVIATGGQTVEINTVKGVVIVDGEELYEPYLSVKTKVLGDGFTYPVTVPEGFVFVMGDNRNESADSRFAGVGFIDERYILGTAVYKIGDRALLNSEWK
ncbi:MAG: signal peptidase I [Ruminococcaceae bacterium]|nr:signal peptidase I [Oscillospiraceae bacterium]